MKKILLMALLLTMFLGMHAQIGNRMLVTYFSWSGSTKNLAEEIQRQTNADIYRIEPLVPYTDDYQELAYQISNKEKEENARPALKDTLSTLNDYDTRDYAEGAGATRTNTAYVYLPYGYDENTAQRYNVIYLVHGHYGTASTTFEAEMDCSAKYSTTWWRMVTWLRPSSCRQATTTVSPHLII